MSEVMTAAAPSVAPPAALCKHCGFRGARIRGVLCRVCFQYPAIRERWLAAPAEALPVAAPAAPLCTKGCGRPADPGGAFCPTCLREAIRSHRGQGSLESKQKKLALRCSGRCGRLTQRTADGKPLCYPCHRLREATAHRYSTSSTATADKKKAETRNPAARPEKPLCPHCLQRPSNQVLGGQPICHICRKDPAVRERLGLHACARGNGGQFPRAAAADDAPQRLPEHPMAMAFRLWQPPAGSAACKVGKGYRPAAQGGADDGADGD